ncbi:MAG: ABC transporter permease [Caulobacteraceae bacterium]
MRRIINIRPGRGGRLVLGVLPLIVVILCYLTASTARHAENPRDKILPTAAAMAEAVQTMAFTVDPLTGQVPLVADTGASLRRLAIGLAISTAITLVLGMILGLLPTMRAGFGPLVATIAVIPPMALLPILFIVFGLGETSKIVLIVVGITPFMVRDLASHIAAIPEEQIVKAQTLGASTWQTAVRVALPLALPRLIDTVRLSLGPAWVFLISAEAIAADVGLGYRIFLVRRYLAMDTILPYVAWISFLAVIIDFLLLTLSRRAFGWAHPARSR